jgi:hypothetical protein
MRLIANETGGALTEWREKMLDELGNRLDYPSRHDKRFYLPRRFPGLSDPPETHSLINEITSLFVRVGKPPKQLKTLRDFTRSSAE